MVTQTILLWDKMSRSPGFGEAPQQAFLRPPRAAKIASVATLALLAVSALPPKQLKKTEARASLTHPPFHGLFAVPLLCISLRLALFRPLC